MVAVSVVDSFTLGMTGLAAMETPGAGACTGVAASPCACERTLYHAGLTLLSLFSLLRVTYYHYKQ